MSRLIKWTKKDVANGYPFVKGPVWKDGCNHSKKSYVCSYEAWHPTLAVYEKFDLYLFPTSYYGFEVCIRYGDVVNEYISPGGLAQFMVTASHVQTNGTYANASKILLTYGTFHWAVRTS